MQDASRAYDRALVRLRGTAASTNAPLSDYAAEMAQHQAMQLVSEEKLLSISIVCDVIS